jgi:hypothetical protein
MKEKMSKKRMLTLILNEVTYFVPDIFLVLAICSIFINLGQYHFYITLCLFIAYVALIYGERFYHKLIVTRELTLQLADGVDQLVDMMNENQQLFITHDQFILYVKTLEGEVNSEFNRLRDKILEGDDTDSEEVDEAEQHQSSGRPTVDREVSANKVD